MCLPKELDVKRFSEYIQSISDLYGKDDDFKTLCDDYCISKMNEEKYQGKLQEDVQRKLEYESLSLELEKEILRYIIKK